jgi:hypothetical protein
MEDVLRTSPVRKRHHDHLVHAIAQQSHELTDPFVIGPVSPGYGQGFLIDPDHIPALEAPFSCNGPMNGYAQSTKDLLLG